MYPSICVSILSIAFLIFKENVSSDNCPSIRLIQPLEESTGLSYVIIVGGKYYMITRNQLESNNSPITPLDLPDGFDDATGMMVYYNQFCSPPQNYVIVYKFVLDQQNNVYDWNTLLNLNNWTQVKNSWTEPSRELPAFLQNNSFMNAYRFSFAMLWHKRKVLYQVQLPVEGAPNRNDYHTIQIGTNNSCDKHEYIGDYEMKIKDILSPYEDFESCFIHNDKQIICFGPKSFTSFDIDLEKTKDGHLRVKNATKNFDRIPIMKIIENIRKDCNQSNQTTITSVNPTISGETTLKTLETTNELLETTSTLSTINSSDGNSTQTDIPFETKKDNWILFLIFLLLTLLLIIILVMGLFCCFLRKSNQKDDKLVAGVPISDQQSNSDQMSNMSMRSQFGDKNRLNESTIGSESSTRSLTNTNENNKTNVTQDISNASTIGDQPSMRSQVKAETDKEGITAQSAIDSNTSMRSQTNTNDKGSNALNSSNTSAIGEQPSMRSQIQNNVTNKPQNNLIGESAIDSTPSMRSVNDSKQNKTQ